MRAAFLIAVVVAAVVVPGAETHGAVSQKREVIAAPLNLEGQTSRIRKQRTGLARDAKSFATLWKEHAGTTDAPAVDFKKYDVVAVFAGEKRTGGHGVRIDGVRRPGGTATVMATILAPGPNMMVTQMLTYPWAMQAVPKLPPTVTFQIRKGFRGGRQ